MIQSLEIGNIGGMNLVPVAAISVPIEGFRDLGVQFSKDVDDLDIYEIAAFWLDGKGAFALMHYLHSPSDEMELMLSDELTDPADLPTVIWNVAEAFHLPLSMFHWRDQGEPASLSEESDRSNWKAA